MTTSIKTFDILPNHHEEIHMDIEQLKLILETVQGISGNAQTVAIVWIFISQLLPMICWMIVFSVLVNAVPIAIGIARDEEIFYKWVRREMGMGTGYLSRTDFLEVEEKLRELVINRNK